MDNTNENKSNNEPSIEEKIKIVGSCDEVTTATKLLAALIINIDKTFVRYTYSVNGIDYELQLTRMTQASLTETKPEKEKEQKWICNECNTPNFTPSVSEEDIEKEQMGCINCGGFEFHKG